MVNGCKDDEFSTLSCYTEDTMTPREASFHDLGSDTC